MRRMLFVFASATLAVALPVYMLARGYVVDPVASEVYYARPAIDAAGQVKHIHLSLDIYPGGGHVRIPVLVIGGGGWSVGLPQRDVIRNWTGLLKDERFRVFAIEYRTVDCGLFAGMTQALPEHSCFPHPARLEDLDAAVTYLAANAARFSIDPSKLILLGDSSGGHTAALYALKSSDPACKGLATCGRRVAGVVTFAGPLDLSVTLARNPGFKVLVGRLLNMDIGRLDEALSGIGPESERLRDADPARQLHSNAPPFLLFHSRQDFFVPNEASRAFRDEADRIIPANTSECGGVTYNHVHKLTLPDSVQPTSHAFFYSLIGVSSMTYLERYLPRVMVDGLYQIRVALGMDRVAGTLAMGAAEIRSVQMRRDLSTLSRQMRAWMACRANEGRSGR